MYTAHSQRWIQFYVHGLLQAPFESRPIRVPCFGLFWEMAFEPRPEEKRIHRMIIPLGMNEGYL